MEPEDTNIRVAVRCRPFNSKEKGNGEESCIKIGSDHVVLTNPNGLEEHSFAFDFIFDQDSEQSMLWDSIGDPILSKAFLGFNGTIFAYGQTGSGKTWSMQGAEGQEGIIPRMNSALFSKISTERASRSTVLFLVTASYFEIYNEVIFDLLDPTDRKKQKPGASKAGLEIKEHPVLGVYVKGLQEIVVDTPVRLQEIIDKGMGNRTVASTQMNADSSRSHSVFQITIHQKDAEDESRNVFAKVNLVDLAGSERVKSTGASGTTLKEGANINKSLSALGNVINALVEQAKGKKGAFVPYRNSKLTRVLQESLGGNSITAMLAALSPAACNFDETLSTLKYANRAKAIKVNAVKNDESSQVNKLNEEIKLLREKLASQPSTMANVDTSELEERHRLQLKELEEAMRNGAWADKARISEEHEAERKRLEVEQRKASRQLQAAKERNWRMLEEKGDLDLSLMHVKELARRSPDLSASLNGWQGVLRDITRQEQRVSEQFTMVNVYQSALQKDCNALLKVSQGGPPHPAHLSSPRAGVGVGVGTPVSPSRGSVSERGPLGFFKTTASLGFDKSATSQWRQLRDKLKATRVEVQKWVDMQEALKAAVEGFLGAVARRQKELADQFKAVVSASRADSKASAAGTIEAAGGGDFEGAAGEMAEVVKGMILIRRQITEKRKCTMAGIVSTRVKVVKLNDVGEDLAGCLRRYETAVRESVHNNQPAEITTAGITDGHVESAQALLIRLGECVSALAQVFSTDHPQAETRPEAAAAATANGKLPSSRAAEQEYATWEVLPTTSYSVKASGRSRFVSTRRTGAKAIAGVAGGSVSISVEAKGGLGENDDTDPCCWVCPGAEVGAGARTDAKATQPIAADARPFLELSFKKGFGRRVAGLVLQGAEFAEIPQLGDALRMGNDVSSPRMLSGQLVVRPLACGLSLAACTGDTDTTTTALAEVLDWAALLKKNPPDKFLKRPPVRFLFDLFKALAEATPTLFPDAVRTTSWEEVAASKQSKLDFMAQVVDLISFRLQTPAVTNAIAIISGQDCDLTNILLQQLAILVFSFRASPAAAVAAAPTQFPSPTPPPGPRCRCPQTLRTPLKLGCGAAGPRLSELCSLVTAPNGSRTMFTAPASQARAQGPDLLYLRRVSV